jgi:hypothetical protein
MATDLIAAIHSYKAQIVEKVRSLHTGAMKIATNG